MIDLLLKVLLKLDPPLSQTQMWNFIQLINNCAFGVEGNSIHCLATVSFIFRSSDEVRKTFDFFHLEVSFSCFLCILLKQFEDCRIFGNQITFILDLIMATFCAFDWTTHVGYIYPIIITNDCKDVNPLKFHQFPTTILLCSYCFC